ncbi:glycosyltransferase [Sedimentibacter hydroxybenzoicus]|nr:glycosyltransferase family A protein [Sedimentibacter hydroxybenzoicus]
MNDISVKFYIIVPVYNSELYLEKCLESILFQTYTNWEAIIVDDNSKDGSFKVLKDYSKKDQRFKVFANSVNQGPGITRNNAIEHVVNNYDRNRSFNYIVFLDSDDWVDKNYLETLAKNIIINKPEVIFIDVIQENDNGNFIKNQNMSLYKGKDKDTIIRYQMTGKIPWGGVRKVVSVDHIESKNIRYTNDSIGEEAIYSFKLLHTAKRISFCKDTNYHYVVHRDSQSRSFNEDPYKPIYLKLKKVLDEMNVYEYYSRTYNSFVYTSVIVSIYRHVAYYGVKKANKYAKEAIKNFRDEYEYDIDYDSLEKRVKVLIPIAKLNLYWVIVMIAYAKNLISKKID